MAGGHLKITIVRAEGVRMTANGVSPNVIVSVRLLSKTKTMYMCARDAHVSNSQRCMH